MFAIHGMVKVNICESIIINLSFKVFSVVKPNKTEHIIAIFKTKLFTRGKDTGMTRPVAKQATGAIVFLKKKNMVVVLRRMGGMST
jgi:hypothetical protein